MRTLLFASVFAVFATTAGCLDSLSPPPTLAVTSPERGLVQSASQQIVVRGTALPAPGGEPVEKVMVNDVRATLSADGTFTATIDAPAGAMLLETVAISDGGAKATDARAVQVGQLRPVGAPIERALTTALSADAFTKLAAKAGPIVKGTDLTRLLAPRNPIATLGDSIANMKLSINNLTIGDIKFTLTPVDGGLQFSSEVTRLSLAATAAYDAALVPSGSTTVAVTADSVTVSGTLVVTPAGTSGFTTKVTSPSIKTTNLQLKASGLVGTLFDLLNNSLGSTIQNLITSTAEMSLEPLINAAFGALAGEQHVDVFGKKLDIQASPSQIAFSRAGALVTLDLGVKIAGSESSPGFIYTPNGMPAMNVTSGVQLGLSDDLLNEMLAEIQALGLLDMKIEQDFTLFDAADIKLTLPPMVSANTGDGSVRLVLGDMIVTFLDKGNKLISAAVNAQVDVEVLRGTSAEEIALDFGKIHVFVNLIDDPTTPDDDMISAIGKGIGLQLDSLNQFMLKVPLPSVAGVTLDNLAVHGDSGYVIASGQIH